ncbi:MAG: thioredoxin [Planctomycetes bacterium]|nr:thioredoxin [Planctomycetota bacterium]
MANLTKLTDQDFENTVRSSPHPVLVDFSATWCQPCKALAPTIEALAKEYSGRLSVYNVDVEEASETAGHFGIHGVPTCIFFKGGKEVDRFSGNMDINSVRQRVEKVL